MLENPLSIFIFVLGCLYEILKTLSCKYDNVSFSLNLIHMTLQWMEK